MERLYNKLNGTSLSPQGRARIIEHLDSAPSFDAFHMTAFRELGSERRNGMETVGKIPRSMIKEYGLDFGMEGEDLYDFVWVMQQVDEHYTNVIIPDQNRKRRPSP